MIYGREELVTEIRKNYAHSMSNNDFFELIQGNEEIITKYCDIISNHYVNGDYEEINGFVEREDDVHNCWIELNE